MPQALNDILNSLNQVYSPQRDVVNQQLGALPQQYSAQMAGLDQAKTNAFSDIVSGSNARGVLYSGVPINEQAKYVGSTYLPKVAALKGQEQQQTFALQDALNKIQQNQYNQAYGIQQNQSQQEAQAASEQAKLAQQQYQFEQQMALSRQKAATSASRSSAAKAPTAADRQKQVNQLLTQAFQGYNPKQDLWFTERVVIPHLVEQTGLAPDVLTKQVYAYRKAAFGE